MKSFQELFDILNNIKKGSEELIKLYNLAVQGSCESLQDNLIQTKRFCARTLDALKEKVDINRVLADERIFLTFDQKFKELTNGEAEKLKNDLANFKYLNEEIPPMVITFIDNIIKQIKEFLVKIQNLQEFNSLPNLINDKKVNRNEEKYLREKINNDLESQRINKNKTQNQQKIAYNTKEGKIVNSFVKDTHLSLDETLDTLLISQNTVEMPSKVFEKEGNQHKPLLTLAFISTFIMMALSGLTALIKNSSKKHL